MVMDAPGRVISQSHHQPNLKRPWLAPNDHFDTHNHHAATEFKHPLGRTPERAREHLRVGYLQGIISPEKNGYAGGSPSKKIRSDGEQPCGLERHIFPRVYAPPPPQDPMRGRRASNLDSTSTLILPPQESSQKATAQSSSTTENAGSNGQQSNQNNGDILRESRHKSLLITSSPGNLIGAKSNKTSSSVSESESFQPPIAQEISHDMQLECNPLLQDVALGLSQLASILRTGKISEAEVELNPSKDDCGEASSIVKCPNVAEIGLKEALRWMLGVIQSTTSLAQSTIQGTSRSSPENDRTVPTSSGRRPDNSEGPLEIMKRRFLDDDIRRQHPDHSIDEGRRSLDSASRDSMPARDRRATGGTGEELPPMQSHSPFSATFPHASFVGRPPAMNPPPAPNRPVPISPPGHQRLSPTAYNHPSPSSSSLYNQQSNPINLPSPRGIASSSLGNLLHPIGQSSSIDATAVANAHTAALQHDVSIRTLALQSLQLEHNNLLAAFSRSQTRAIALEKKHLVSDTEINSLSEERTRLQTQVAELEQSVEELSRSRDEARQSAVQEGAQYVQMIKMAGQLEEKGREERRAWEKLKADMEARIERLTAAAEQEQHKGNADGGIAAEGVPNKLDTKPQNTITGVNTPPSSAGTTVSSTTYTQLVTDLREEIQRLRNRCSEFERTLLAVRSESLEIESVIEALGKAGRRIREKVDISVDGQGTAFRSSPDHRD